MMESLWNIVSGAPWWVYVLLIYLVSIGTQATKPRTLSIQKIVILPLLFLAWTLYGLSAKIVLGFTSLIFVWLVFLGLGVYLGMKQTRSWQIAVHRQKGEITIPGNHSTLVLIILIFVLKFFWGAFYATHTQVSYWIYFADTVTSSLIAGFFAGRAGFLCWNYKRS